MSVKKDEYTSNVRRTYHDEDLDAHGRGVAAVAVAHLIGSSFFREVIRDFSPVSKTMLFAGGIGLVIGLCLSSPLTSLIVCSVSGIAMFIGLMVGLGVFAYQQANHDSVYTMQPEYNPDTNATAPPMMK